MQAADEALAVNPNDGLALFWAGMALLKTGRQGTAFHVFQRCSELAPTKAEPWNNAGLCLADNYHFEAAIECYRRALALEPDDDSALQNIALCYLNQAQPKEALKWLRKVKEPSWNTVDTRAMALLALREWKEGWKCYRETAGKHKERPLQTYCTPEEPMWNGEPGTVVLYANQGIGDEIAFASCVQDAMDKAEVVLDCDHRLEGLFKRSFPCHVYGTRHKERHWDHAVDYSLPLDCLPSLFRNATDDFPGKPYLVADPERRLQWRALFDSYRKPVIGIAWTGGLTNTGRQRRSLKLEDFLPLFKSVDAVWVSLEYKDRSEELERFKLLHGIEIRDYPQIRTQDYDDTAGLVAELDLVISVTTAVVHLSGALGTECWCLTPNKPRFFYGLEGEDLPWYASVWMWRQKQDWPINDIARELKQRY
jgi:hypothetical protein